MEKFICKQCGNKYISPTPLVTQEGGGYVVKYSCNSCGAEAYRESIGDPYSDSAGERLSELSEEFDAKGFFSDEDLDKLLSEDIN